MKKILTLLSVLVSMPAGAALASDDCFVPIADWQPRAALVLLAEQNDWTVRRIKIDDGCYEIDGRDASGRAIEVTIHPATLEIIEIEYEDDDDNDDDEGEDAGDDRRRRYQEGGDND